ncbi:hypothetical protein [Micromonospora sp. SH-82]|uniref:hypothetical protein n=1 Tax=Micromonospora sp. SH-82 TaxID=3132938 RepID=UPI003EB870B7
MKSRRVNLTSGGLTSDLRPLRDPLGNPALRRPLPTRENDVRNRLNRDLTSLVAAMQAGRESTAWELLREARALVARLPRGTCEVERRKINAATRVLRSPTWRRMAAATRHRKR